MRKTSARPVLKNDIQSQRSVAVETSDLLQHHNVNSLTKFTVIPRIPANIVSPSVARLVIRMHNISVVPEAVELSLFDFLGRQSL